MEKMKNKSCVRCILLLMILTIGIAFSGNYISGNTGISYAVLWLKKKKVIVELGAGKCIP